MLIELIRELIFIASIPISIVAIAVGMPILLIGKAIQAIVTSPPVLATRWVWIYAGFSIARRLGARAAVGPTIDESELIAVIDVYDGVVTVGIAAFIGVYQLSGEARRKAMREWYDSIFWMIAKMTCIVQMIVAAECARVAQLK
jgi:hypothetical protein